MSTLSDILKKGNRPIIEGLLLSMIPADLQNKIVERYEAQMNNGQSTLFGVQEPETLFKDSPLFNLKHFLAKFDQEVQLGIDVEDYHRALILWTEGKGKRQKRTVKGWIATAHTFMRRDKKEGKLQMVKTGNENNLALDYLNT